MEERLQKLMAQSGLGSRRACEQLILAGRVTVNGRVAGLGEKADPRRDRILVDGQPLRPAEEPLYVAIYKPRGVLSTVSAPDPRPTVRDRVDLPGHLYPVGRLDVDSEGLVLLTNDGELANRLTHPRYEHEKEYRVLVASRPDDEQLATWRRGVVLDEGYKTQPAEVRVEQPFGKGAWLRVILKEGRKRQIRETGSKLGLPVVKIIRVRIGSLTLGGLQPGEWRVLSPAEVEELKQPAGARGAASRRDDRRQTRRTYPAKPRAAVKAGAAAAGARRAASSRSRSGADARPPRGGDERRRSPRGEAPSDPDERPRRRSADRDRDRSAGPPRTGSRAPRGPQSKARKPARSGAPPKSTNRTRRPGSKPGSAPSRRSPSSKKPSSR